MLKKSSIIVFFCCKFLLCFGKDYPASLFGISSDGVTLNTRSIQFAIDYIHQQGGGRLVFDVGRFLTGTVHLKSGVTLHLLDGAVIVGSLNPLDYDKENLTALILAKDQRDIAITGNGLIDGQGRQVARNVIELIHKGLIKDLFRNDRPEVEDRPMLIYFRGCENVLIKNITLHNASAWVQTYDQCKHLQIDSIRVDSRAFWNNDGFDIVDCDSVSIAHCYIDADDDGICLKSHDPEKVCRNIMISNCTIRSSANAIKFGTASLGGFQHIHISNIKVFDTYRSAIALEAVDGGFIEDVEIDSLNATNTGNAIFLRIGERINGKKGRMESIRISNVFVQVPERKPDSGYEYEGPIENMPRNISPAVVITGLPGAMITHASFNHLELIHPGGAKSQFANIGLNELDSVPDKANAYPEFSMFRELPAWGIYIRHATDIQMNDISLLSQKKDYRTPIVMDDVHRSEFISIKVKSQDNKKMVYQSHCSGNITK